MHVDMSIEERGQVYYHLSIVVSFSSMWSSRGIR